MSRIQSAFAQPTTTRARGTITPGLGQPIGQPVQQPVQGPPAPITPPAAPGAPTGGGASQTAGTLGPSGPTPNPYNLPPDLAPNYGDAIYQDIERAHQQANRGNIQRLNEAKAGYQQLEQDYATREQNLMQQLQGLGDVQRSDLQRKFEQEEAGLTQDMINRGIYSTTTAMNAERGLRHDQQQQQLRLEDMLTRERMDYARGLSADTLGARGQRGYLGLLERVNETGPDPNMAAQLGQLVGAGQAGTPDYLSGLGQPTGQAPSGPAPTGGTLAGPAPGDYNVGTIPQNRANTTGARLPANDSPFLSDRDQQGGLGGQTAGGTGGTGGTGGRGGTGSRIPSVGPGGTTDRGPGIGGGGGSGGGTIPTPVPTPPGGRSGGSGGAGGAGGSGGGGGPKPTDADPGGDGPDVVEYKGKPINVVAQDFYQKNVADRLSKEPNWRWWEDGILYAMAPEPLQMRMNEIRKNRQRAGA